MGKGIIKGSTLRSGAFRLLLFSITGVALVAISLIFVISVRRIADTMDEESTNLAHSKLRIITKDMETMLDSQRAMVLKVATLPLFRLDNIESDKYQEIEILEILKGYKDVAYTSDSFFLKYESMDNVFTSYGTTMPIDICLNTKWLLRDTDKCTDIIDEMSGYPDRRLEINDAGDGRLLFVYSLSRYSPGSIGRRGALVFLVTQESFLKRAERVAGQLPGDICVLYSGQCILGDELVIRSNNVVSAVSNNGQFEVFLRCDNDNYLHRGIASMGGSTLVSGIGLLLVSFMLAWWNFNPVRRLAEKYDPDGQGKLVPDWNSIDAFIASLLSGKKEDGQLLNRQHRLLCEQTIRLMSRGDCSRRVLERAAILGIRLDWHLYGIITCTLLAEGGDSGETLLDRIEDLAGEEFALYPFMEDDMEVRILAATNEEYQFAEIRDLVVSLFEAIGINAVVSAVSPWKGFDDMERDINKGISPISPVVEDISGIERHNRTAERVIEYIQGHCSDYNLSLDMLAEKHGVSSTYLSRLLKEQLGMSYKQYLTGLRIEEAKKLLCNPDANVAEVCQRVGFNNVSYFIKIFTQHTGMTPAKYRDEKGKE